MIRFSTKLGYGIGQLSDGIKNTTFSIFRFFYYRQVLGVPGSLAGTAALIALMVDAITDPWIGQWSDSFQSRWGRRHPFMLAGALPFAFAMIMLFNPPDHLSTMGLFGWMLGFAVLVRLLLTFFFVPHLSLGAELEQGYHARTSIIGYRVFFAYFGALLTSVVGFALFFPPSEAFPNGMLDAASYPSFGIFTGLAAGAAMLICIITTWKVIPMLSKPVANPDAMHPSLAFIEVFRTLRHKAFRVLFSTTVVFMVMTGLTQTLLIYVASYVFGFSPEHLALLSTAVIIGLLLGPGIAQKLSQKYDKKPALATCLIIGITIAYLPQLSYLAGIFQPLELPVRLAFVFTAHGISQAFFIAFMIILDSMLTDSIDEHELHTNRREEGLYFAARSFATKASFGIGAFLAGIGLDVIRFPKAINPADIPVSDAYNLAVLSGPVAMAIYLLTAVIIWRYPLNAARHAEIRQAIKNRRKEAPDAV
jgi:Na+/melibiose symporter-like transporter